MILITGFPKSGKSTLAKSIVEKTGAKHYCTDPQRLCDEGVTGIPDYLDWSNGSQFVSDKWIGKKQLIEGVAIPRALRKWRKANPGMPPPCEKLILLQHPHKKLNPRQIQMGQALMKVLYEIVDEWPELARKIEIV